jgi:hypothetical protein
MVALFAPCDGIDAAPRMPHVVAFDPGALATHSTFEEAV